jgi:hypothetical protein
MKNKMIAIGAASMLISVTATAAQSQQAFQQFPSGSPGPEGSQYVVPAQRAESISVPSNLPKLTVTTPGGGVAHILPTAKGAAARARAAAPDTGPLLYHEGGVIMPRLNVYEIFWGPRHLQTGDTTGFSSNYLSVQLLLGAFYSGHGIGNNNTQYFQVRDDITTYIDNDGGLAGSYFDTSPYPASGCTDSLTPGNCLSDLQIQAEILKVMQLNGWTGGLDKIFLLFTSSGEGSCMDSSSTSCAYTEYCAYHSFIGGGATPIIYGNEPYGDPRFCQISGVPSPNNDANADTAATAASHEVTEAITDPLLNAWFTAQGNEIGDLCAYNYGDNTWDAGAANQAWSGHFFELQTEFDNHVNACVQLGP